MWRRRTGNLVVVCGLPNLSFWLFVCTDDECNFLKRGKKWKKRKKEERKRAKKDEKKK